MSSWVRLRLRQHLQHGSGLTFDQKSWHQVTPGEVKAPCLNHYGGSAEDPQRGVLVFFGGYCTGAAVQWDGSAWTAATPSSSPPNRG